MPSPHRRLGLVVDEPIAAALALVRDQSDDTMPEARVARKAMLEGAAVGALLRQAATPSDVQHDALSVLRELRRLLPYLGLPAAVREEVESDLRRVETASSLQQRRRRQLALLASPNPFGDDALQAREDAELVDG